MILLFVFVARSQTNIQAHYEVVKSRRYPLLTIENFTIDNIGSTYFFVDMVFKKDSLTETYFEIVREFNLGKSYFAHIEYNSVYKNNSYLLGITYLYEVEKFNITLTPMLKYIVGNYYGFQVTSIWNWNILDKLSFNGFIDIWQQNKVGIILITEPVIWYNFNKTFSIGCEVEISNTLNTNKICPSIALKYTL